MTPILHIRSFTDDQYWIDKVFYTNSYRLRGIQDRSKATVVVDIGAHCGYFTFTALALGAKKVYAVEPFLENYKMLLKNTGDNPFIVTHSLAILNDTDGSLNFKYPKPEKSHIVFSQVEPFTTIGADDMSYNSPNVSLDTYLRSYVRDSIVDILKINIGYQERDILKGSTVIEEKVNSICGETIIEPENISAFKAEMSAKGFINSHVINSEEEVNKVFFIFSKGDIEQYYSL